MARPPSLDPAIRTVITLPRSIRKQVFRAAKELKLTTSGFILKLAREYFDQEGRR